MLPPTWAPTNGAVYGDWCAKRISSGLIVWDYTPEIERDQFVSVLAGVSSAGTQLDADVDYASVRSDSGTNVLILPTIATREIQKTLHLYAPQEGFRIRCGESHVVLINGETCSQTNELPVLSKMSLQCTPVNDFEWKVQAWNGSGESIGLSPIVRGADTINENGVHSIVATSGGATISELAKHATITSSNATYIIQLPKAKVGKVVTGWVSATGFELSSQGTGVKINNVDCSSGVSASIPSTTSWKATCVSTTEWILEAVTELGAVLTAIVPS